MQKRILIAATAALLSLPLALNAADEGKKKGGGFGAVDTDGDGKISKAEFTAMSKTRGMDEKASNARFDELDKDKNGSLSREEFAAAGGGKKKEGEGKKKSDK
jgi:Ca2+-binding EF-hand superfamily protein